MILIEAGEQTDKAFDAKLLVATQLAARGHQVVLDDRTRPEKLERYQKYEAAAFLADLEAVTLTRVVLIGAESVVQETMMALRGMRLGADVTVSVTGRFGDRQSAIAARAKVAYAIGREPDIVDLAALQGPPLVANAISPLAAAPTPEPPERLPQLFVVLPLEALDDPQTLPILSAVDNLPDYRLNVILPGKGKEQVKASRHAGLTVFGYSELSPAAFARLADIAAFFGDGVPGERMAAFALDLMRSGRVAIDCTSGGGFLTGGAPVLRGPEEIAALANYIQHTVLVNRREIGRQAQKSPWLTTHSVEALEGALGLGPVAEMPVDETPRRVLFVPTNGIGLGHAQRCTLIAEAMVTDANPAFAAFPSCVPLIRDRGFDCLPLVQKSPDHPEDHANDLLSYLRLRRVLRTGDRLVFDGGFVFDSIHRVILEHGLDATWIRRGLWQAGQTLATALDRERAFARVIVPSEAFAELNADRGAGAHVHTVGPIVRRLPEVGAAERTSRREALGAKLGRGVDDLVVTMLGGGVAADRTAQMQALSAMLDARPNCLHLIVVWPGAVVPAGLASWKNTCVVQTQNALALCQIADLVVSATGYNSFHELLYHGVPTIFVPQMATFMDDQERRARAASDRGLAETVLAHEILLLEREVRAFLDAGKADRIRSALAAADLPETGNGDAASLILGKEAR
ncbi:glycosyltransferase [Defluviimonas sp. SAOS-178_SWC]|uniref:glycosyltransferase n=1 Tax=Defluviimonas sp. SAOS-178_SWC TaxID=3121287 RepID=UPI003221DF8A